MTKSEMAKFKDRLLIWNNSLVHLLSKIIAMKFSISIIQPNETRRPSVRIMACSELLEKEFSLFSSMEKFSEIPIFVISEIKWIYRSHFKNVDRNSSSQQIIICSSFIYVQINSANRIYIITYETNYQYNH